eukprot:3582258-Amphidinium_carterae.1
MFSSQSCACEEQAAVFEEVCDCLVEGGVHWAADGRYSRQPGLRDGVAHFKRDGYDLLHLWRD